METPRNIKYKQTWLIKVHGKLVGCNVTEIDEINKGAEG